MVASFKWAVAGTWSCMEKGAVEGVGEILRGYGGAARMRTCIAEGTTREKRVTYFMDAGTCATHAPLLPACTHMDHANAAPDTSDRTTTTVQR